MGDGPKSCSLFVFNRWFSMVAGVCMTGIAGTPLLISVYLGYIQDTLNFTQAHTSFVATACNLAMSLTIIPGFFFDRFGPRPTAILSGILLFSGYFGLYLGLKKIIPSSYLLLSLFSALIGVGSGASFTSAVTPNIHNFPAHSGKVVGALASMFGLSGAIFTQIYNLAFSPDVPRFLLFLSITLASIAFFIGGVFINYVPKKETSQSISTNETPSQLEEPVSNPGSYKNYNNNINSVEEQPLIQTHVVEKEFNPLEMVLTIDFYLVMVLMIIGPASQFVLVNNLGSITSALSYGKHTPNNFVIILSVTNFLGTILAGVLSDLFSKKIHRPVFLVASVAVLGLSNLFLGFSDFDMLYPALVFFGIAIGIMWAMIPSIVHELWGNKHWGFNYGLINLGPALGSYLFATLLASHFYEKHASHQNGAVAKCYGIACYRDTFFITAGCCGVAVLLGVLLCIRTRQHYLRKMK